jgi:hypothetical protein
MLDADKSLGQIFGFHSALGTLEISGTGPPSSGSQIGRSLTPLKVMRMEPSTTGAGAIVIEQATEAVLAGETGRVESVT